MAIFNFCPERNVPVTMPPDVGTGFTSASGWNFTSRPPNPYQRRFKVKLHGLRWYLTAAGLYDPAPDPLFNARALELFYQEHQTWKPFTFKHQHIGDIECRFYQALTIPEGLVNSGGLVDAVEVMLVEHNPGY